ncbi:CGNR zinc finger domain-containing protein [Gracilibacillus salitolerans]|uniref:CGNR zinc finger domain-containing protein n=1 Tax=Gracilibacillus salitolerans TaxID=2663022 RepID=A0A5Q2TF91_9BACI|nr:CGNR zinc finger domain-containing protein [Gracilibacillus salitolerans]QGH32781.1 CGNR zinc finger domain-containing protein [Gracilibacillus salitolerans]
MDKSIFILGGTAWINLVNTTYISNNKEVDILADKSSTLQWLKENNLLRESDAIDLENKELINSLIIELHSLRKLCNIILFDIEQKGEVSLNATNQLKKIVEKLKVNITINSENNNLKMVSEGVTVEDHVLYNIIGSIIHTLENTSIGRIRKCEHEECILYFVDTSKSGKRRWCSMELCGNRKKAAEFYAKKKKK